MNRRNAGFLSFIVASCALALWRAPFALHSIDAGSPAGLFGRQGKMEPMTVKEGKAVKAVLAFSDSAPVSSLTTGSGQSVSSKNDSQAIEQTALDYIEGWYEGNVTRMERSLHPDLVKRVIRNNKLDLMTKSTLVEHTRHGKIKGKSWKVNIFDVYDNIATVKVDSTDYMDYLQVGKVGGKWVIVNVLWAPKK